MTQKRPDGASEGFHTGGPWLYQGKVWKPLDGRPYANANVHIETSEEACLTALQGKLLFPKNWEIKEVNGRRFLVRDHVDTFPGGSLRLTANQLYEIQRGIDEMNNLKWEVNDDLVIGKDKSGKLFIVDLSAANYTTASHAYGADDSSHFKKLCEQAGFREISALKSVARELSVQAILNPKVKDKDGSRPNVRYFYSSDRKVELPNAIDLTPFIDELPQKDRQIGKKYFWMGSPIALSESVIRTHRLRLQYAKKSF